jgi:hypothetical protein
LKNDKTSLKSALDKDTMDDNLSPAEQQEWLNLLFLPTYVGQVVKTGISLQEAKQIFEGKVDPERSTLVQLLEDGTSVDDILLLRQMGVYFFRTGATKQRPLREIFMDSAFGSSLIRQVWELTGATTRQAMTAVRTGVTPYAYVNGAGKETEPPKCSWIMDEKKYQFQNLLPEVFLNALGEKRNDAFLEAVGFEVGTRNLKAQFLDEVNPELLLETGRAGGKKVCVALSKEEGEWRSRFLATGTELHHEETSGDLAQVGGDAIEYLATIGLKIRSITIRPSLRTAKSEYFTALAGWFEDSEDLPSINGNTASRYVAIDGTSLIAPKEESKGRPGTDTIKKFGDLVLRFVGTHQTPIVVISDSDDETIRSITQPELKKFPREIFADVLIKRHVLQSDGYDSYELHLKAGEFQSLTTSGAEAFTFGANEIVEIWCDEKKMSIAEVLTGIRLAGEDFEEFDDEVEWQRVRGVAANENLWIFDRGHEFFLYRPPIFVNGSAYLATREDPTLLLELDDSWDEPWPKLWQPIGQFSLSEWASMTSGTDFDEIGFSATGVLVSCERLDEGTTRIDVWGNRDQNQSSHVASWLLQDEYGHKFKALLFIEELIGELPRSANLFADWLDEDQSSTLEIRLSYAFGDEAFNNAVMDELMKDEEISRYVKGITDPDSDEGRKRKKRQEVYHALHNRE